MEFWSDILTEKSWNVLLELKEKPFKFILIGGWAAYLWTKLHKSKDVDIILFNMEDINYLKENFNLKKNDNLKKYEISFDEIDVDIYVPYYSRLAIPPEDLKNYVTVIENISVVVPEVLLILKQGAELDRTESVKGSKDRIDIMSLLCLSEIDFRGYNKLLSKYKLDHFRKRLQGIIRNFDDIKYLDLTPRQFKLKKKELMSKI
ncbi:MAG: hypothetical protein KJ709_00545 [Nanoarchaeota archaeon]|nr:hypothetical protein [Nanoarchaeota archaeon]